MPKSIHLYRPQRTDPQSLEATFVAREPIIQEVTDRLGRWESGKSRQHYLFIGPRGIGKTNLLCLIEHRIHESKALNAKWDTVFLAEESYSITRATDLLIEALRILADDTNNVQLFNTYEKVKFDDDNQRVTDLVLDAFRSYHRSTDKGLLLIVENVNRVFEKQIRHKEEIHLLRKILIEEEWLTMICTSPTFLSSVTDPEKPLFEFFQLKLLAELTQDEQINMLKKLARLEGNKTFESSLVESSSKIRALHHFTGGNPRLTVMLYDLVANSEITTVKAELDLLLDQLTPFYQDRMRDISEQEGRLLETMALSPEGCTPTELAERMREEAKKVRAFLTRLAKAGYVRPEQRREKRTVYIIQERLFRIWHQMNHSRAAEGIVQYLLEFFSRWYATKKERKRACNEITAELAKELNGANKNRTKDLIESMDYIVAASKGTEKFERILSFVKTLGHIDKITVFQLIDLISDDSAVLDYFATTLGKIDSREMIKSFISVLNDEDPINRGAAATVLGAICSGKDALITSLNDEDSTNRDVIIAVLENIGLEDAVQPLINVLSDEDPVNRGVAATALGKIGSEEVVQPLINVLNDEESIVCVSAATALGEIASEKAVQPLIAVLNDKNPVNRGVAATALGKIGSEKAVQPLIAVLSDEDPVNRGVAATALGKIGSKETVKPLITTLNDKSLDANVGAVGALMRIIVLQNEKNNFQHGAVNIFSNDDLEEFIINLPKVLDVLAEKIVHQSSIELPMFILLQVVFASSNLDLVTKTIVAIQKKLNNPEFFLRPYLLTVEYLKSNKDPTIIERQQPEIREAMELLVKTFEQK